MRYPHPPQLNLVATDMVPEIIAQAQEGRYRLSSLKYVTDHVKNRYFQKVKGKKQYEVRRCFQADIEWRLQDLLNGPADECFQIIFLRNNLLTYYQNHLKIPPFMKICQCLASDGWLIIGSHEKLPTGTSGFVRHQTAPWAYQKVA